ARLFVANDAQNDFARLLAGAGPMDFGPACFEVARELREVLVQMVDGLPLGFGGCLARRRPILEGGFGFLPHDFVFAERGLNEVAVPEIARELPRVRFEVVSGGLHERARTSARWMVLSLLPCRSSRPWRCIRQLESFETIYSAPVS